MVQLLRNRARSNEPGLDETIVRCINLAQRAVATRNAWWFLKGVKSATTESVGSYVGSILVTSALGVPASPLSEYCEVYRDDWSLLPKLSPADRQVVSGPTVEGWYLDDPDAVNMRIWTVPPTPGVTLRVRAYWCPVDFPTTGWNASDTNAVLMYVPDLVVMRAWLELAMYLGRPEEVKAVTQELADQLSGRQTPVRF
jgi:hypothetical protein